jgi:hypothetical protein
MVRKRGYFRLPSRAYLKDSDLMIATVKRSTLSRKSWASCPLQSNRCCAALLHCQDP